MSCSIYVTCSRHDILRGRRSRDLMLVGFTTTYANLDQGVVYNIM